MTTKGAVMTGALGAEILSRIDDLAALSATGGARVLFQVSSDFPGFA